MTTLSSNTQPSRMRAKYTKKLSPLFSGHNFPAQLQTSSFGLFSACLEDIAEHLPAVSFKLPCVIVVGGKSAGKSSLLEMITKCPIFPRHSDFCTKLPIKLRLRPAATLAQKSVSIRVGSQQQQQELELSEIAARIDRLMTETDGISSQEVIVEMCKVVIGIFAQLLSQWQKCFGRVCVPQSTKILSTGPCFCLLRRMPYGQSTVVMPNITAVFHVISSS